MKDSLKIGIVHNEKIPNWIVSLMVLLYNDKCIKEINFYQLKNNKSNKSLGQNLLLRLYLILDGFINKEYKRNGLLNLKEVAPYFEKHKIKLNRFPGLNGAENNDVLLWLNENDEIPEDLQAVKHGIWYTNLEHNLINNLTLLFNLIYKKDTFPFRLRVKKEKSFDIHSTNYRFYDKSYFKSLCKFEENLVNIFHSKLSRLSKGYHVETLITNTTYQEEAIIKSTNISISFKIILLQFDFVFDRLKNIFLKEQWFLVLMFKTPKGIKTIKYSPTLDKFWADPFLYTSNSTNYLFYEEYEDNTGRGNLSYVQLGEDCEIVGKPKIIIKKPYHFSYPFLFEYDKDLYMIPETSENKSIELYKAVDFPDKWEKVKNIMDDVFALDTTLFHHNDIWWMFTNIKKTKDASSDTDLHLFYSNNPIHGEWQEHPKNPIVTNIRTARPAGKIYMKGNKIFRPSQDCSKRYGYGVVINEIEILSATEYKEKVIESVVPDDKNIIALHTINSTPDKSIVVFDAMNRINKYQFNKTKNQKLKAKNLKDITPFERLWQQL